MKRTDNTNNVSSPFLNNYEPIEDPKSKNEITDNSPHPYSSIGKTLARWQTDDHPPVEFRSRNYVIATLVLIAIIAYAISTNSPLMAIVFILIGTVGYLSLNRSPETILYSITTKGIIINKEFYEFDHLRSFWIIEDHPEIPKELVIETSGALVSHLHIPLADQNPEAIRSLLRPSLPEKKYEPGLIDTLGKILHI